MKTKPARIDPANDTHVITLFLDKDEEENALDVESSIHHSKEQGFYLVRTIIQIWQGRTWETADPDEAKSVPREHRRSFKVIRRLTPPQVICLIVGNTVPEEEGARALALAALKAAGIN